MIKAAFFTTKIGLLVGFEIKGHSSSALSGADIICSAVSSAAYMTANTVTEVIKADAVVSVDEEGEMYLRVSEKDAKACQEILSGFKLHMFALEEQYPDNIHVNYTEV